LVQHGYECPSELATAAPVAAAPDAAKTDVNRNVAVSEDAAKTPQRIKNAVAVTDGQFRFYHSILLESWTVLTISPTMPRGTMSSLAVARMVGTSSKSVTFRFDLVVEMHRPSRLWD
jgi:hypothetical protein